MTTMQPTTHIFARALGPAPKRRGRAVSKGILNLTLATALGSTSALAFPIAAATGASVEFDVARAVECRDVTPRERILQYPTQRLVEVELPVSVRFNEVARGDVDEIDIEVSGATAGLRVQDFAPATQLASEITREIETTLTTKKARSLEGTLGGSLPIPGAEAARVTPSITGGLSGCETATEKINRLPPKDVVVVSGTYSEGRGVFFKLKRTSQTSLEGVHELAVTFVAPRNWTGAPLQVKCAALGQRKLLWMKQDATLGEAERYVQLMPAAAAPIRQVVLKPADDGITPLAETTGDDSAASPTKWRPSRPAPMPPKVADKAAAEAAAKKKAAIEAAMTVKSAKAEMATTTEVVE
jgi:hypothetical protein